MLGIIQIRGRVHSREGLTQCVGGGRRQEKEEEKDGWMEFSPQLGRTCYPLQRLSNAVCVCVTILVPRISLLRVSCCSGSLDISFLDAIPRVKARPGFIGIKCFSQQEFNLFSPLECTARSVLFVIFPPEKSVSTTTASLFIGEFFRVDCNGRRASEPLPPPPPLSLNIKNTFPFPSLCRMPSRIEVCVCVCTSKGRRGRSTKGNFN